MAAIAELRSCDGFKVESLDGVVGWVEETWLDSADHPAALALRTPDGQRALLPVEAVTAVDADNQEVLVPAGTELYALDAPRIEAGDGSVAAHWRTLGAVVHAEPAPSALDEPPSEPLAVSRAATAKRERPLWQVVAFALCLLVALILSEIGADFLIAYLVTGALPY